MSFLFLLLGLVLGVFCDRYIIPALDLVLQRYSNNKQLEAMKVQKNINIIENEIQMEALDTQYESALIEKDICDIRNNLQSQDMHLIGFKQDCEDLCCEDDDEDCCHSIGFKN